MFLGFALVPPGGRQFGTSSDLMYLAYAIQPESDSDSDCGDSDWGAACGPRGPSRIPIVAQWLDWAIYDGMDTSFSELETKTFEHEYLLLTLITATGARGREEINQLFTVYKFKQLGWKLPKVMETFLSAGLAEHFVLPGRASVATNRDLGRSLTLVLRSLSCVVAGKNIKMREKNYIFRQKLCNTTIRTVPDSLWLFDSDVISW